MGCNSLCQPVVEPIFGLPWLRGGRRNVRQGGGYGGLLPPKPDLPHIAVAIYPDGEVTGIAAYSAAAAADIVRELAVKVGANIADDDYA